MPANRLLVAGATAWMVMGVPFEARALVYEDDILPIMREKCFRCHGDGESKGSVAFDPQHMHRLIGPSKIIRPGTLERNRLYEVLTANPDDDSVMPPPGKGDPMTSSEVKKVTEWMMKGAATAQNPVEMDNTGKPVLPERKEPLKGEWTNHEGKTISATLLRVVDGKAVLQTDAGRVYYYLLTDLSEESQKVAREWAGLEE